VKDETEQKSLPASHKKLRDARRKAHVSRSRDLVSGVALLVIIVYLLIYWSTFRDHAVELADTVAAMSGNPTAASPASAIELAGEILLLTLLPPLLLIVVVSLIAGVASTLGPVFSFEPVKPKFDNIDPVQGLKRIFSLRNVIEWIKSLLKVVILGGAFWLVLRSYLQSLFELPACGEFCLGPMVIATLRPLALTAAVAFVFIGIFDVALQYQLFLRDMRMTKTEYKREQKELQGDPLIRGERRRFGTQMMFSPMRLGLQNAVLVVSHGPTFVGLRYVRGETPLPLIVTKARGDKAAAMLAEARGRGLPIFEDAALAESLASRGGVGDYIRPEHYQQIARLLMEFGIVS